MSAKPKVAFYWCASCGGCEEAVVDLEERILDVVAAVDIVLWPVALDFKYDDLRAMPDGSITAAFINGAIRTEEQQEIAELLRRKSQVVVAFGACAISGGIPALANLTSRAAIFDRSYHHSPTVVNPEGVEPQTACEVDGHAVHLPAFFDTVKTLDAVIDVDYYLPGCAPSADSVATAVTALLTGALPPKGAVLAPDVSLCTTCERNATKPEEVVVPAVRRVVDTVLDEALCFLAQGVICMGPATRDGCGVTCVSGNMPCTGCYGPTDACKDQGAKMIAALGGIIGEATPDRAFAELVDPAGTFYRYGVAASQLGGAREGDD